MGNLPIHIYGYNNEHDVIVYTVVKDTQSECGQSRHRFQKSPFLSVYTETLARSFLTKTGSAAFLKRRVLSLWLCYMHLYRFVLW